MNSTTSMDEWWRSLTDEQRLAYQRQRHRNESYKTALCSFYDHGMGTCKYGSNCNYAHSVEELRLPPQVGQLFLILYI